MNKVKDYISPIFEHILGDSGRGFAGFTVHQQGKPFANNIRLFNKETRTSVMEELHKLRKELIEARDLASMINQGDTL
ncbi:MAG: hypothetical protein CVU50_05360 [Candidatus Cloacimonetes bacterium HGW-Cloacimonetes-3]|jgi:hypothetical protein|nr:MAG: hypothetical protein CVU50_05360 [Candidatus Cloacimonetes bacterium HGW-Cloacimonetes-3]